MFFLSAGGGVRTSPEQIVNVTLCPANIFRIAFWIKPVGSASNLPFTLDTRIESVSVFPIAICKARDQVKTSWAVDCSQNRPLQTTVNVLILPVWETIICPFLGFNARNRSGSTKPYSDKDNPMGLQRKQSAEIICKWLSQAMSECCNSFDSSIRMTVSSSSSVSASSVSDSESDTSPVGGNMTTGDKRPEWKEKHISQAEVWDQPRKDD